MRMENERSTQQLEALGVKAGDVLVVHTSFRAIRPIEGGPLGLIAALRGAVGPHGTIVMPTMTDGESVFDPRSTPTTDMGIVAETFWRKEGVVRSTHPGGSFAAEGPHAEMICAPQPLSPPHGHDSPVGRVYDLGGRVLLLGVGHSENTSLHLAEAMAGVPYSVSHPCVVEIDGKVTTMDIAETDHCCRGFAQADEWMRAKGAQREGIVGSGKARLVDSRVLVDEAIARLRRDPLLFLCPPASKCDECDLARASVTRRAG
jgi:aminoglycoside 3-N-acetyltransferase